MFAFSDGKDLKDNVQRSVNVQEEYHRTVKTKSYADFFTKAQTLLLSHPSIPSNHTKFCDTLLEPCQRAIPSILNHSSLLSHNPNLKPLFLSFFDITASASNLCTHLLKSIEHLHHNYLRALDIMDQHEEEDIENNVVFDLESFVNPKNSLDFFDFGIVNKRNASVLESLKETRKKVARKMKYVKFTKRASGVCITLACGLVAIGAAIIASHALTAIVMGGAVPVMFFGLPLKSLKRKVGPRVRVLKSGGFGSLGRARDQLDVAAKGTYILSRDFDTMSRLVVRLRDEVERKREMVRFWMWRRKEEEKNSKMCVEIVKELRKSEVGFRKQVEELEEHVYLCLVTINRARALVVKGMMMASSCINVA